MESSSIVFPASPTRSSIAVDAGTHPAKATERLPFTIRRVDTEDSLMKAVQIRHAAYARHVPEFARTLAAPETSDYEDDAIVLLAESKLDGSPIGTARIQTNFHRALHVEDSIALPSWLQGRRLAEVTRLGIGEGRIGRVVKIALIKASEVVEAVKAVCYR